MATNQPSGGPISWDVAHRVASRALRLAPELDEATWSSLNDDFGELILQAEHLVEEETGLRSTAGPANAVVTDRAGWVEANLGSFKRLLAPLAERLSERPGHKGQTDSPVAGAAAGAEIGLVLAWISSRVLGQYDVLPGEDSPNTDAVYFVGPNIVALERRHGFAPREFRLWIAIHEVTHRMQFTGVPWMKGYFLDLVERGTSVAPPDAKAILARLGHAVSEAWAGNNPLEDGGIVALLASTEQLATLKEAQGLMSLLEGHGNAVMSSAGADEIPGAKRFARVLSERRSSSKGVAKLIQQAIGLDAKLRQYDEGERFVEKVLQVGGPEVFAHIWSASEMLPTIEEIRDPERWIERSVAAPTTS